MPTGSSWSETCAECDRTPYIKGRAGYVSARRCGRGLPLPPLGGFMLAYMVRLRRVQKELQDEVFVRGERPQQLVFRGSPRSVEAVKR